MVQARWRLVPLEELLMEWDSFIVGFALGVFVALALVFEKWLQHKNTYHFTVSSDTGFITITRHIPQRHDGDHSTGSGCGNEC